MNKIKIVYPFNYTFIDYPDNESVSILLYFYGCDNGCFNCHNKNIDNNTNYKEFTIDEILKELYISSNKLKTNKIVFSGGDCLYRNNINFTKELLNKLKFNYDICIYTGYNLGYIKRNNIRGFKFIKIGKYENKIKQESFKTDDFIQFASRNQNLYDSNLKLLSNNGIYFFK
jgi:organic radical activating enzyme